MKLICNDNVVVKLRKPQLLYPKLLASVTETTGEDDKVQIFVPFSSTVLRAVMRDTLILTIHLLEAVKVADFLGSETMLRKLLKRLPYYAEVFPAEVLTEVPRPLLRRLNLPWLLCQHEFKEAHYGRACERCILPECQQLPPESARTEEQTAIWEDRVTSLFFDSMTADDRLGVVREFWPGVEPSAFHGLIHTQRCHVPSIRRYVLHSRACQLAKFVWETPVPTEITAEQLLLIIECLECIHKIKDRTWYAASDFVENNMRAWSRSFAVNLKSAVTHADIIDSLGLTRPPKTQEAWARLGQITRRTPVHADSWRFFLWLYSGVVPTCGLTGDALISADEHFILDLRNNPLPPTFSIKYTSMAEKHRFRVLESALAYRGLSMPSDLGPCHTYIKSGVGDINLIVLRFCQLRYLYEFTNYEKVRGIRMQEAFDELPYKLEATEFLEWFTRTEFQNLERDGPYPDIFPWELDHST